MDLKEYRNEFIPILLNSESFYSQYYAYYVKCLIRINQVTDYQWQSAEKPVTDLVRAIQV